LAAVVVDMDGCAGTFTARGGRGQGAGRGCGCFPLDGLENTEAFDIPASDKDSTDKDSTSGRKRPDGSKEKDVGSSLEASEKEEDLLAKERATTMEGVVLTESPVKPRDKKRTKKDSEKKDEEILSDDLAASPEEDNPSQ